LQTTSPRLRRPDAAWALVLLLGRRRRLREVLRERGGLPGWLVDDCHAHVGDSAETIALPWPQLQHVVQPCGEDLPFWLASDECRCPQWEASAL